MPRRGAWRPGSFHSLKCLHVAHDDQAPTQGAGARKRKDCLPVSTRRARWQLNKEQEPRCVTLRKEQEPETRNKRKPRPQAAT